VQGVFHSPIVRPFPVARCSAVMQIRIDNLIQSVMAIAAAIVPLTIRGPWIRNKQLVARAAFASVLRTTHRASNLRKPKLRKKRKKSRKKIQPEEASRALKRTGRRKRHGRKWNFKPPAFGHFNSSADRQCLGNRFRSVAAAESHNVLLIGPPGADNAMFASRWSIVSPPQPSEENHPQKSNPKIPPFIALINGV